MKTQKTRPKIEMDKNNGVKGVDERKTGKRKAPFKADNINKRKPKKEKSAKKDPNKPKRPASAFFVFMEEFRKKYKREHPNVGGVSAVAKAGGEKWNSMSSGEKLPFESEAAKRKEEYEKLIKAYMKKEEHTVADDKEDSDGSKSDEESADDDNEGSDESESDEDSAESVDDDNEGSDESESDEDSAESVDDDNEGSDESESDEDSATSTSDENKEESEEEEEKGKGGKTVLLAYKRRR